MDSSNSYQKLLEQAKLRRQQGHSSNPSIKSPAPSLTSSRTAPTVLTPVEASPPSIASSPRVNNGLPFDDHIYDQLRFVISKLTAKIKSDVSLSKEDLLRFEEAVEEIVADARQNSADSIDLSMKTVTPSLEAEFVDREDDEPTRFPKSSSLEDNVFSSLKGGSWKLQGMENMSTKEYYAALNKRNAEIRELRRQQGLSGPGDSDDYIRSLSQRTR
eukprot:scaffold14709_cov268-Ochromonas_danica.AAC.5